MFSLQDAEHPQPRDRRRVRRLPGHRQGRLERPRVQAPAPASAPSTRSTGRACWRRSSTTSPATSRRRRRTTTSACQLRGAVGQLRQHLRRPRRAHDGPADRAAWCSRPTRTTCSTSSSAPAPTACAAAPRRTRPRARRWTSRRPRTSSASCSTCSAASGAHARAVRARASSSSGAFTLAPDEFARIAALRLRLGPQHARRPRSRRSATPAQRFGAIIDTHTADGLKVAREQLRARRADDRARDRAAGEVRRDHRRGARPRAAAARRAARHRAAAEALQGHAGRRRGGQGASSPRTPE